MLPEKEEDKLKFRLKTENYYMSFVIQFRSAEYFIKKKKPANRCWQAFTIKCFYKGLYHPLELFQKT
jgi:hypothetical protein